MTDIFIFPDSWLPSSIVKREKLPNYWELVTLKNSERVLIHSGCQDIIFNVSDEFLQKWLAARDS